jgi:intracellular septation protein A
MPSTSPSSAPLNSIWNSIMSKTFFRKEKKESLDIKTPSTSTSSSGESSRARGNIHTLDSIPDSSASTANAASPRPSINVHSLSYSVSWGMFLLNLLPLAAWIIPSQFAAFYLTIALPIAFSVIVLEMIVQKIRNQPVDPRRWLDLLSIMVIGGVGYFIQTELLLKLQFTITATLMTGTLLLSELFGKTALIKSMFSGLDLHNLSEGNWSQLSLSSAEFLGAAAALNAIVAQTCSNKIWFCLNLGLPILTALFRLDQLEWAKSQRHYGELQPQAGALA